MSRTLVFIIITLGFHCSSSVKLNKKWYKNTFIYEIITTSFKDSDGDGIGDFKGIISKMPHFEDLGVETIHLTPIYSTPLLDMGYDISDFYDVDRRYGTMEDFEHLTREMKKRDMKLIVDLVINHSSNKHEWFQKSIDRIDPYTDFYVWKDSKGFDNDTQEEIPPNNWSSFFGGPGTGWTWVEKRKQFYYHCFMEEQPDLNLRNPILKEELKKMIKYWLDKGVTGFRVDAVRGYMEDELFRDNTPGHYRQMDPEGTMKFVKELRKFLDEYNDKHGGPERIFMPEVHGDYEDVIEFYDHGETHKTQMPYTYYLRYLSGSIGAKELNTLLTTWFSKLPKNAASAWVTEDHDGDRVTSRLGPEYTDILLTISMLLPGTVGIYYGQEIGIMEGYVREDQIQDQLGQGSRDPGRLIMQWDSSINAGFSTNMKTFLPANSDYFERNVDEQRKQKISHYNLVKTLSKLRRMDVLKYGNFQSYVPSEFIFMLTRSFRGRTYIAVINLGIRIEEIKMNDVFGILPNTISVVATSVNAIYPHKYKQDLQFQMSPLSCIVFEGHNS